MPVWGTVFEFCCFERMCLSMRIEGTRARNTLVGRIYHVISESCFHTFLQDFCLFVCFDEIRKRTLVIGGIDKVFRTNVCLTEFT